MKIRRLSSWSISHDLQFRELFIAKYSFFILVSLKVLYLSFLCLVLIRTTPLFHVSLNTYFQKINSLHLLLLLLLFLFLTFLFYFQQFFKYILLLHIFYHLDLHLLSLCCSFYFMFFFYIFNIYFYFLFLVIIILFDFLTNLFLNVYFYTLFISSITYFRILYLLPCVRLVSLLSLIIF